MLSPNHYWMHEKQGIVPFLGYSSVPYFTHMMSDKYSEGKVKASKSNYFSKILITVVFLALMLGLIFVCGCTTSGNNKSTFEPKEPRVPLYLDQLEKRRATGKR